MTMNFRTNHDVDTAIEAAASVIIPLHQSSLFSAQVNATVASAAKTAAMAVAAVIVTQGLTITAVVNGAGSNGAAGNSITVTFTAGGTAGSEVVTVVGSAISVKIATNVSTVTQVRTAMQAAAACTALVTTTGTNTTTVVAAAAVSLATGADSNLVVATGVITSAAHGFFTGTSLQVTKDGAAFPDGIAASTTYYVFKISASTFQLFNTLANALAATLNKNTYSTSTGAIVNTISGSIGSTLTFTPVSVSGASYKLQVSNDYDLVKGTGTFVDAVAAQTNTAVTNNITATASSIVSLTHNAFAFVKILFAISAGTVGIKVITHNKSE